MIDCSTFRDFSPKSGGPASFPFTLVTVPGLHGSESAHWQS